MLQVSGKYVKWFDRESIGKRLAKTKGSLSLQLHLPSGTG